MFCPDLQKLLKPIVELTRKDRPFIWGDAQEKAFREVKLRLTNPPVLHLPKAEGRFILYSDTSIEGTGSSLWQIQEGKPKLIGYASKTLPEACSRYSVTELEMTGLLVNMNPWKNLLKHREFDAAVDHVAVAQIMKAKTEPATTRIMMLLNRLSALSFNLYYVKGRDTILSDYLSRHRQKDLDPSELIPISFCCLKVYRSFIDDRIGEDIFCIKTRSSAKSSGEQSEITDDMPAPIQNPTPMGTLVSVQGGAWPKTHQKDGTPLLPPTALPSPQPQPLVLRRILSSTPLGENGENVDRRSALIKDHKEKRQILRDQNRNIFHPPPIEGIDIGVMEGL